MIRPPHSMRILERIAALDAEPGDLLRICVGGFHPVVVVRQPRTASLGYVADLLEHGVIESEDDPMPDYVREALDAAAPEAATSHLRLV